MYVHVRVSIRYFGGDIVVIDLMFLYNVYLRIYLKEGVENEFFLGKFEIISN